MESSTRTHARVHINTKQYKYDTIPIHTCENTCAIILNTNVDYWNICKFWSAVEDQSNVGVFFTAYAGKSLVSLMRQITHDGRSPFCSFSSTAHLQKLIKKVTAPGYCYCYYQWKTVKQHGGFIRMELWQTYLVKSRIVTHGKHDSLENTNQSKNITKKKSRISRIHIILKMMLKLFPKISVMSCASLYHLSSPGYTKFLFTIMKIRKSFYACSQVLFLLLFPLLTFAF